MSFRALDFGKLSFGCISRQNYLRNLTCIENFSVLATRAMWRKLDKLELNFGQAVN